MYEEVKWAKDNGIVKGYKDSNGDDVFLPNKTNNKSRGLCYA